VLFDLKTGKRRRVIQVVFGFLAFIFFISFVGFGIGSDVSGGIFDALGLGSGGGTSGSPQFDERIEAAEEKLAADPKDERALLALAEVRYQAGQFDLEQDPETGQAVLTDESRAQFEEALDAWERYLALDPKEPKADTAALVTQAYVQLGDAAGAAEAQRIVAEDNPSGGTLANLAFYLYAAGNISEGDEAAARAVQEAEPSQTEALEKQLDQIAEQARELKEQAEKQAQEGEGAPSLEEPFGGLGGGTGIGGTAPPAP
jgi:tetratricopeptide (TPR) repeat protein